MKLAVLITGIVGMLIGLAISAVSFGLHLANRPRISFEEALPGIIGGGCCCSLSLAVAVGGLAWMLFAPKDDRSRRLHPVDDD